jgi:phosphotriesterase-related protein
VAAATNMPGPDMVPYLKQLSERSGIHIIPTGALYTRQSYPPDVATRSEDQLADDIVQATAAGRFGAYGELAITPGAAEIAPEEKKVYRAFAKAHVRTGIPIFTHNNYATGPHVPADMALRQLDVFESAGADPRHLAIGHVCCLDDTTADVPKKLARRGVFVAFDRLTRQQQWVTDERKLNTILAFLDAGFADQLLFSSDYSGSVNAGVGEKEFRTGPFWARDGGPGWARSVVWFHPMLRKAGVKEDVMRRITVDNPRRFLAFVPRKA